MILVTGATGNVGGLVVEELLKRGANVRVLARKHPGEGELPSGMKVAIGDLLDPVSVQKALLGVDKLYLLNAVTPDELTQGLIAYVEAGFDVQAVMDASGSSYEIQEEMSRGRMERAGVVLTTNTIIAELVQDWSSPQGSELVMLLIATAPMMQPQTSGSVLAD